MGKGARGQQQQTIQQYGQPGYNASNNQATQANNLYYGNPQQQQQQSQPQQGNGQPYSPQALQAILEKYPPTYEGVAQAAQEADRVFGPGVVKLLDHPTKHDKFQVPGGAVYDLVNSAGGPNAAWNFSFQPEAGTGGAPNYQGPGGVVGGTFGDYGGIRSGYQNFADTGGFSPEDLANIRARAVSPIRSVYSSARRDIDRQRALQGGYSPNRTAALAKMAREQSYATSDASTNTEGMIAQMIQQGKLSGLGGMAGLYGTTPGLANMFGNQALQSQGQANQMGIGMIGANQSARQLPTGFQSLMGNISQGAGMIAPFINPTSGLFTNPFGRGAGAPNGIG